MPFYLDAKNVIVLLKQGLKEQAVKLILDAEKRYPSCSFFRDIHGLKLEIPDGKVGEISEKMSDSRHALFLSYVNAKVIEFAIASSNDELREEACDTAQKWLDSILDTKRQSHPSNIILQGYIFRQNGEYSKAIEVLKSLSSNSRYWPLALRLICCSVNSDAPPTSDLYPYYDELIKSDLSRSVFLPSCPVIEEEIDSLAKFNCVIYLTNLDAYHGKDSSIEKHKKAVGILETIQEKYWGEEYFAILGSQFVRLDELEKAETTFKKSISIHVNTPALAGLANVYRRQGIYDQSLMFADKALALSPNHLAALTSKGVALYGLGRHTEAISILTKIVREEPFYILALDTLGKSLVASGESMINFASLLRSGEGKDNKKALTVIKTILNLLKDV